MNEENKISAGLIIRLLLMLAAAVLVIMFLTGYKLENIEVKGGKYYSAEEIKAALITEKTDRYAVLFAYRINNFSDIKLPFVEKLDVELVDKNSVIIYVYDKPVIGCIEHMENYIYFDREGVIADNSSEKLAEIPLIKGLEFKSYTLNDRLETVGGAKFDTILEVIKLLEKYNVVANDITFNFRNEIILHVNDDEILLGKSDSYAFKISNLEAVMSACAEGSYRFDFRNYSEENLEVDARPIE